MPRMLEQEQQQHVISRSLRFSGHALAVHARTIRPIGVNMRDILFAFALGVAGAVFLFYSL